MLDEFFLLDNPKNRSNIITVVKLDKIKDYDSFRQYVIKRATQHGRSRHYLKKFCSEYFFSEMEPNQLQQAISECYIRNDTIKSNEDICAFVAKEQTIRDSLSTLQYKFVFVPDFNDSESLIIYKSHHVFCDGVATLVLTSCLQENGYEQSQFPRLIPRLSLLQQLQMTVVKFVTLPISIIVANVTLFRKDKTNEISLGEEFTGVRKVVFSAPLNCSEIRDKLKKQKSSINDYIVASATLALSQIALSAKQIHVSMPFTLKDFPANVKQLNVGNDFALLPVFLKFPKVRDLTSIQEIINN